MTYAQLAPIVLLSTYKGRFLAVSIVQSCCVALRPRVALRFPGWRVIQAAAPLRNLTDDLLALQGNLPLIKRLA